MSAEELSYQLPRRSGGSNLTWHDGRGQKTAHTRTVKLLQQPGTEGIQVSGRVWKMNMLVNKSAVRGFVEFYAGINSRQLEDLAVKEEELNLNYT